MVYKINEDGSGFVKLFDFVGTSTGGNPSGGLMLATDGDLYGRCGSGGANGYGTIFKIKTDGSGFVKLYDFNASVRFGAGSSLIQATNGKIYGMTPFGGANSSGAIFSLNTDGSNFTKLLDFSSTTGSTPFGSLIQAPDHFLYGTLSQGGFYGSIFRIKLDGTEFTQTHKIFNAQEGIKPMSTLLVVSKLDQTISFSPIPAKTFGDPNFSLTATSSSGLPVSFTSSDLLVATITGNMVTIVGGGTATISAIQAGDNTYTSVSSQQTLVVNKANQTITFPAISTKTIGEALFNLSATSTSGLAIQYSTLSDKISISGSQVALVKPGNVSIKADQVSSTNYNAAASVSQTFCINPLKPTITATGLNSETPVLTSSSSIGNQWYKNGTLIPDAVSSTYSPMQDGAYTVKVTVDNCSSELSAEKIHVITGDITSSSVSSFLVYPNPVKDNLSINLTAFDGNSQVAIVIYDVSGKVMDKILKQGEKAAVSVHSYSAGT